MLKGIRVSFSPCCHATPLHPDVKFSKLKWISLFFLFFLDFGIRASEEWPAGSSDRIGGDQLATGAPDSATSLPWPFEFRWTESSATTPSSLPAAYLAAGAKAAFPDTTLAVDDPLASHFVKKSQPAEQPKRTQWLPESTESVKPHSHAYATLGQRQRQRQHYSPADDTYIYKIYKI